MVVCWIRLKNYKNAIVDELCMIDDVSIVLMCSEPINIVLIHFG